MLRVELELALLEGTVAVRDLPRVWNEKMQEYLGIVPPNDADGVLQDIHWSAGLFGYFATYTMGNVIAAQLWQRYGALQPDRDAAIARGDFSGLLQWLRTTLHHSGRKFTPQELLERAVGGHLDPEPYLRYLETKYGAIYGLEATPKRFTAPELRPKTPVKDFYMAGCDIGTLGVTTADESVSTGLTTPDIVTFLANVSGLVDMVFASMPSLMPVIGSGAPRVRALAVTSMQRASFMPALPTLHESGVTGYDRSSWVGVLAPASVPRDIIAKVNAALAGTVNTPEMKTAYGKQGLEAQTTTPEQFAAFIAGQLAQNAKLIRAIGLRPD